MSETLTPEQRRATERAARFFKGLAELFFDHPEVRLMWGLDGVYVRFPDDRTVPMELIGARGVQIADNADRIAAGLRRQAERGPHG